MFHQLLLSALKVKRTLLQPLLPNLESKAMKMNNKAKNYEKIREIRKAIRDLKKYQEVFAPFIKKPKLEEIASSGKWYDASHFEMVHYHVT